MIHREHITGAILAGGRGRRMGGADKGLVMFRGRPLIAYVIDVLRSQVGSLVISANRNFERYAELGHPVVADDDAEYSGPLGGIARILESVATPYLLVVPCDMPFLPSDLAVRLARALIAGDAEAAVAHDGERLQPLCTLLARGVAEDLGRFRASGEAKAARWVQGLRHVVVDFPEGPAAFRNINTPADLRAG